MNYTEATQELSENVESTKAVIELNEGANKKFSIDK